MPLLKNHSLVTEYIGNYYVIEVKKEGWVFHFLFLKSGKYK